MYSSYSVAIAVCSVIFSILASVAVFLRFRARITKSSLGADDWVIAAALCLSISLCVLSLYSSCIAGFGEDLSLMSPTQFRHYQEHLYAAVILTHLSEGTVKLAVILLYKRIFSTPGFRRAANILIVIIVVWMLAATFTQVFSSWPVSSWFKVPAHHILNYGAFTTAFAALDVTLDIVTLCFPLPMIMKLHMDSKRKWTLAGIFWLGIFCVVAGAVRLYFGYKLSFFKGSVAENSYYSYISVNLIIWSEIEPCVSIVAACLPTFGHFLKNGLSMHSSASSVKSWLLKKMTSDSDSTNSDQLTNKSRLGVDNHPRGDGPWNRLDNNIGSGGDKLDLELGEVTRDGTRNSVEKPKRVLMAKIQHVTPYTRCAEHVEQDHKTLRRQKSQRGIQVQTTLDVRR